MSFAMQRFLEDRDDIYSSTQSDSQSQNVSRQDRIGKLLEHVERLGLSDGSKKSQGNL